MSRLVPAVVILAVVMMGALFLLGRAARERPVTHVEQAVSLANLT